MKAVCYLFLLLSLWASTARAQGAPPPTGAPTAAGNTAGWETYTYPDEEFSVMLPEMPSVHQTSRNVKNSIYESERARIFGAYGDGVVYLIHSYDKPRGGETIEFFASYFRTYSLNQSAEMYPVGDLALGRFKGRKYAVKLDAAKETWPARVYVYLAKRHAYVLQIVGAADTQPAVQQFLTSFTLTDKPAGLAAKNDKVEAAPPAPAPHDEPLKLTPAGPADAGGAGERSVFSVKEVTRRAYIVSKPEPGFTEEARRNSVTGEVVLRMVLAADGHVTNIVPVKRLPDGLTEHAILAARHIKFIPALKDGRFVSQYVTVAYNFNIY